MPVVGTAGHVDHGKSTLVRALTGREPDRWQEERDRGLTIDLGFAWTEIAGHEVSFVDVPGHEQFIKNMLAGIESIDVALLVVAADEGWMPQSEEHLAVLDLLDVRRGVVALTKIDRVDDDLAELAQLEIGERLEGSSLELAPIVGTAAVHDQGVDRLREELERLLADFEEASIGRPRLWVDRSFSITGAGTVVTGTLLDGELAVGDQLHLWPADRPVRVRAIQSHEHDVESAGPQRRVALNLSGIDRTDAVRGSMLGRANQWTLSNRFHVAVERARYVEEITDRGAYHVHIGSGSWPGRVRMLDEGQALVTIDTHLPLAMGDRFILRDTGRRLVVGGGRVLDPAPPARAKQMRMNGAPLSQVLDGTPDERAQALLSVRGLAAVSAIAAHSRGGTAGNGIATGDLVMSRRTLEEATSAVRRHLESFHGANPLRPGMPTASLPILVGMPSSAVEAAIDSDPDIVREGATVRLSHFMVDRADRENDWATARRLLEAGGPSVPRTSELDIDRELLHALIRDGELVRISDEFVFLPSHIEEIVDRMKTLSSGFTVSEFKDATGLSRKYAVPFLEWADRTGLTVRTGDTRRLL